MKQKKTDLDAIKAENRTLRERLQNVEETLRAVQRGEIDALVVSTPEGEQLFTLSGVDKQYRLLIEEMKEGAVMLSDNDTILYCNSGFANIIKQPFGKIIGTNIKNLIAPTHNTLFEELLKFGRMGEGSKNREVNLLASDKTTVPTQISVNSLQKDDAKTTFLVITDLTKHMEEDVKRYTTNLEKEIFERKKAEKALKTLNKELDKRVQQRTEQVTTERQRLYNVLETLPSYVILLDRDYRVRFANRVFRESFGEHNGRRCHEYLFGKDHECENCETYKVIKQNKPQHWYWTGPNGHDYDIYDFPFKEADGSILILEMGIDITERKKLEKQLKDSERMIAIGQTAGMVGHDIRNPLQAMISDVYLAKSDLESFPDGDEKEDISESLDSIQKNVEYINKIVQDLQDYARPLAPAAKEIDLQGLIEEVLFRNGVPENVEASCKVTDEAKRVTSDADLLKRVLANLVNNAVQAMPDGGKLSIFSYKDKETAELIIDVEDSGCGIPESVKPNLFTPMFTTKSKGQGFGLAVVKRITESMGGTVSFESVVDKGTTFRVRLPPPQRNER